MFIPRVYLADPLVTGQSLELNKNDLHYLNTVLRLKTDSPLILFNGQGGEYSATFHLNHKKGQVVIGAYHEGQPRPSLDLHLGQSLLRGDRMDWIIEKATELGVFEITPLISRHCLVKIDPKRLENRLEHWQKIVVSACEQCGRTTLPQLNPPLSLYDFIAQPFEGTSLLLEMNGQSVKDLPISTAFRLAIGPESGWTSDEIDKMIKANFLHTYLGPRILRAETAGAVALSLLQGYFGDLA